jgi:hypothetical protein
MPTIEDIRNLTDPQRSYKWRVILPLINDSLVNALTKRSRSAADNLSEKVSKKNPRAGSIVGDSTSIVGGQIAAKGYNVFGFNPSILVEEVQGLPFPSVEREAFYEGGRNTYFPSIEDVQPVTFVFYVDESNRISEYVINWKRLITNEDGTKNLPAEYKKSIRIQLLNGEDEVVDDFRLEGCFPTATTPYNLAQESGRLTLTQEFSVDRVEQLPANFESLGRTLARDKINRTIDQIDQGGFTPNDLF